jgi:hypothetical protein
MLLDMIEDELEAHKVTADCEYGDGFYFSEINPHCVDRLCSIKRDILSVRLISRDAVVDDAFIKELDEFPEGAVTNGRVETKRMLASLHAFLVKTKACFEASVEIERARKEGK